MTERIEWWVSFYIEGNLALDQASEVRDETCHRVIGALEIPKKPLSQAQVLIAEDEWYLCDMLLDVLEFLGVDTKNNVQVVSSGMEIQTKIREWQVFDLLLSDNHMNWDNGSDAIEALNKEWFIDRSKTFVVMQTGKPELLNSRKENMWAHHILGKPYSIALLKQILSERFV